MIDIISIFSDYGITYNIDSSNTGKGWISTKCIFCNDHSDHLGWNLNIKYVTCWKCGAHNFNRSLALLLNVNDSELENILLEYSDYVKVVKDSNEKSVVKQKLNMPGYELEKRHIKYLKKRNFDVNLLVDQYKIKGTGVIGEWRFRVMIPIFKYNKLVAYQGRDITGKQKLRYRTLDLESSIIPAKNLLYNEDNCYSDSIIVVEGVFDVWRMGINCVSTLGTSITIDQIELLSKYKNIFFLFDDEIGATEKAKKACYNLAIFDCHTEIIKLDNGKDPADLSQSEADKIKKELLG